jgi:hypothetical protein
METNESTPEQVLLESLRRRRAEMRESMSALERALAGPAPGRHDAWAQHVHVALVGLSADFHEHVDITEGPRGLYCGLLATAPRLSNAVARLTHEHAHIRELVDDLLAHPSGPDGNDAEHVRELGMTLLGQLVRHRQRGSDLIYDAYEVDIGGET